MLTRRDPDRQEEPSRVVDGATRRGEIRRGEIYSAGLRDCSGKNRQISRPVLVIQNDVGNRYSQSIIVSCVSSNTSTGQFPVVVDIPQGSIPGLAAVCLNQIMMVDKSSLGERVASLPSATMARVDEALRVSLGLPRIG